MPNYLDIKVPKGSAFKIQTDKSFVKLHQLLCCVGRRGSGKTTIVVNFLRMMKEQGCLDRLILITPTYESNKSNFQGLPVDEDNIINPDDPNAVQQIRDIVDAERDLLDEYYAKLDRYNELIKQIKSRRPIEEIDEFLLEEFGEEMEKPKHYLDGRKPVIACFIDDALGTRIYGNKSGLSNLVILHRHLGVSKALGSALGITMIFATQSYKSNVYGISPTIRNNCTCIAIFKTKSDKELQGIAEEVAGFCTKDQFMDVYEQAMTECGCGCKSEHNVLFIDTSPHEGNSHFRKNMNTMLYPKVKDIDVVKKQEVVDKTT
jgi:hypothetical protein